MAANGTALSNVFSGRFQTLQAGLSLDLNLRNRAAEANFAQSVIAERRLNLERVRTEQAIEAQVRNALRALETARQRMAAATASARRPRTSSTARSVSSSLANRPTSWC